MHICQIKSGFHFLHTDPNFKTCLCGIRKQSVIKVPTAQTNSLKSIDIALYVDFREWVIPIIFDTGVFVYIIE